MRTLVCICLFGALTIFGSAAGAADFANPTLLRQTSLVIKIKDHHNDEGKHHHHQQGDNGDEGNGHRCKGSSCKKNGNAGRDSDEDSINSQKTTTPDTTTNSDVLWGDYKYVKPSP